MNKKEKYLSVKEASEYLGIPLRTVYHLVKLGKIRSIRFGGKIRCISSDVKHCHDHGTPFRMEEIRKERNHSDRRKYPRINTSSKCIFSVDLAPLRSAEGSGIIKNLAPGGVFLLSQEAELNGIHIDDPVDISFALSAKKDRAVTVKARGRVLRKDGNGIAVKFRDIDEKMKKKIKEYIG